MVADRFVVRVADSERHERDGFGNKLVVEHDGKVIAEEQDYGEPEDNSFTRDYRWVAPLLRRVYELGLRDGGGK